MASLPALLSAALLLASPDAHAGTYVWKTTNLDGTVTQSPTYTGGSESNAPCDPRGLGPFVIYNGHYTGYASGGCAADAQGNATFMTLTASGPFTAKFTWQPAYPGEPAPASVIICEDCGAGLTNNRNAYFNASSVCTDGFGDNAVFPTSSNVAVEGCRYVVGTPGSDGSVSSPSVSPGASSTVSSGLGSGSYAAAVATAGYTATATPVTIGVGGGTSDGQAGWDVLVGQKVTPFLIGIPASCTISDYQWTVTGTTMQSWTVSSDSTHTTEVDGSGPLNIASPVWFWNDPTQASETITCTATVTPPVGEGSAFGVRAILYVGVYLPTWSASGSGGTMNVRILDTRSIPGGNNTDYWLTSDPISGSGLPSGMNWRATLAPAQGAPVSLGKGNIELVQLVTPSEEYITFSDQEYQDADQGQQGLDQPPGGSWFYGWITYEDDPDEPYYITSDSPASPLSGVQAIYGSEMDSFVDYIMYQPPNSPEYVPLGYFKWNLNGTAEIPSTNNWANFKNPAGIIEPSGSYMNFTPDNTYPSWTRNSGDSVGFVPAP